MKKKIIVSVISDVVTDQRVQKECNTLHKMGYEIILLGRKSSNNFLLKELPYKVIRFYNLFSWGPLMYGIFNVQLFFYLLFAKVDLIWANDLDTLLPNFIISKIKRCLLVYDSHEYFTLSVYKNTSRKVWEKLEQLMFPKLKNVITVSPSIQKIYEEKYKVRVTVIRNVPYKYMHQDTKIQLPKDKKNLVIQGRGINENRGAEEAVLMMKYLQNDFNLYFIGSGTILQKLQQMVIDNHLSSGVFFIDVLPYSEMMQYTQQAFLGLIFEKIDVSDHHRFALPNKFFDCIQAGVPVLASRADDMQVLIEKYGIGSFIESFDPQKMAEKIIAIAEDTETCNEWKRNTARASSELNWENEEQVLMHFMKTIS